MRYMLIDAVGVRVEMHHEVTSILKNGIKLRYSLPAACMIIFSILKRNSSFVRQEFCIFLDF